MRIYAHIYEICFLKLYRKINYKKSTPNMKVGGEKRWLKKGIAKQRPREAPTNY